MKLSNKAKEMLKNKEARLALMTALGFSEVWVTKCIEANKPNGPLTTISALKAIQKETGLTQKEILEDVSAVVA